MPNAKLEISRVLCYHQRIDNFRFNLLKKKVQVNFIG